MSEIQIDDADMRAALERIAATPDGWLLYMFLQKALSAVPINPAADALRELHGRRMFAAELMAPMGKGIRASHGGSDPTERPITFVRADPARVERRTSARAWLRDNDPELTGTGSGGPGQG